jgi:hypothetical protein
MFGTAEDIPAAVYGWHWLPSFPNRAAGRAFIFRHETFHPHKFGFTVSQIYKTQNPADCK